MSHAAVERQYVIPWPTSVNPTRQALSREPNRRLTKTTGLASGTTKYIVGSRAFILVRVPLSSEERELLTDDLLLTARANSRAVAEQLRNGGRS